MVVVSFGERRGRRRGRGIVVHKYCPWFFVTAEGCLEAVCKANAPVMLLPW